jgi:hypothetical protein
VPRRAAARRRGVQAIDATITPHADSGREYLIWFCGPGGTKINVASLSMGHHTDGWPAIPK